jgi:hypothetical protein
VSFVSHSDQTKARPPWHSCEIGLFTNQNRYAIDFPFFRHCYLQSLLTGELLSSAEVQHPFREFNSK